MQEDREEPKIQLSKYRKHKKQFLWSLLRKIIIAIVMIALFYYLFEQLKNKEEANRTKEDSIPVEITE